MLGAFLGFAIDARRRAVSFEFYRSLGFESVPVTDAGTGPYAAFSDGHTALALHDPLDGNGGHEAAPAPIVPTFVRPNLQAYVRAYRRLGIALEIERLASDEFNEVAFSDPGAQPIRVLEARTYSPAVAAGRNVCACGTFLELSLGTRSIGHSQTFWEALGFRQVGGGWEPHAWIRLEGYGLAVGLYEGAPFSAALAFRGPNLAGRTEYLKAKGFAVQPAGFPLTGTAAALLTAPEGTRLYMLESQLP